MRRSTIAVFLLLWLPSSASACFDDHLVGWFSERPSRSRGIVRTIAEGIQGQEAIGVWGVAIGTVSAVLIVVSFRAVLRARGRGRMNLLEPDVPAPLVLPFDWPSDRPIRVDQGRDQPGPVSTIREDIVKSLVGEATSDRLTANCPL
jgi:hypothetical protein